MEILEVRSLRNGVVPGSESYKQAEEVPEVLPLGIENLESDFYVSVQLSGVKS